MPAKYSHTKKRPPGSTKKHRDNSHSHLRDHRNPNIHVDRSITQAMSAVSKLERTIAKILLIRFEQDIARLFSTHLYCVALLHLPTFVMRCITVSGPGWVAANADCDEIKDFFRSIIGMDLRQAGERVATKSVLWSYTALRHFVRPLCISTIQLTSNSPLRHCPIMSLFAANAVSIPSDSSPTTTPCSPTSKHCKQCPHLHSPNRPASVL